MSTIAGFLTFVRTQIGISTTYLPDASTAIADAYALALEVVNPSINDVSNLVYDLAVYNLAGDNLINNAGDQVVTNTSIAWSGGVATVTTSSPHGFATGTNVVVSGTAPTSYSGSGAAPAVSIIVTGSSTYTYVLATNPGSCTQAGNSGLTFFTDLRKAWNITGFVAGVVASSSDVSTSETLTVMNAAKDFQFSDLQYLKTPYGRAYQSYAQRYGYLWGLS